MADALSQETRIKSGAPQGPVIEPLLFLLFVNDLPSVINVTTLIFADDVKTVSPHSQGDLLQDSFYNGLNWSVNCDLPITFHCREAASNARRIFVYNEAVVR